MKKTKADLELEVKALKEELSGIKASINFAISNIMDRACEEARPYIEQFYNDVPQLQRPKKSYVVNVPFGYCIQLSVWDGDDSFIEDGVDIQESEFAKEVDGNV